MKEEDHRRASYKLIPPTGKDEGHALVKLEAHCATSGRTWYELPRYTTTIAKGWFANAGPKVNTPVELVILEKGGEVKISKTDENGKSQLVMTVQFDGNELKVKN
jgi:SH3-like domain-containing protein